ncbi:MAG TPA: AmmeMemoRadiSam system protein B [Spirillospora sp.]|nr:AmmeMemoRadiSam system protein B [Spirillospora sp.]
MSRDSPGHRNIRKPAFSGLFYPADPDSLREVVRHCLARPAGAATQKPRILIVPHAGYLYSGPVAGAGFAQVRDCSTVILLGVSHRHSFETVAAYFGMGWQTPLGTVLIDRQMVLKLVNTCPLVSINNSVHRYEHTLEVQLPFLQEVLEDFRIVPLLLGNQAATGEISTAIAQVLDDQTLLVVSSDLCHYPGRDDAESVDRQTIEAILSADPENFQKVVTGQLRKGVQGLLTCACGATAIEVALRVAQMLCLGQPRLLAYQNSGEVTGDARTVVGYASIAFC